MDLPSDIAALRDRAVSFHGHFCPGLAIGIQAARIGLATCGHDGDEDVVAVVETDMCAVDAIQALTGCTFGKGNLVHRDYGKNAFTFYRRRDGAAVRLLTRPDAVETVDAEFVAARQAGKETSFDPANGSDLSRLAERCAGRILALDPESLFTRTAPAQVAPRRAAILESLVCDACGETVMESRTRRFAGQTLCIPCFRLVEQKI